MRRQTIFFILFCLRAFYCRFCDTHGAPCLWVCVIFLIVHGWYMNIIGYYTRMRVSLWMLLYIFKHLRVFCVCMHPCHYYMDIIRWFYFQMHYYSLLIYISMREKIVCLQSSVFYFLNVQLIQHSHTKSLFHFRFLRNNFVFISQVLAFYLLFTDHAII